MIKKFAAAALLSGLIASPIAIAQDAPPAEESTEQSKGEQRLEKLLEGREAGEPSRCIRTFGNGRLTIIDETAIVYKDGDTVWVNRTRRPQSLDDGDVLVIRKFNASQLCRLDQITTIDRYNQFYTGNVFLTDFVPYKRVKTDQS